MAPTLEIISGFQSASLRPLLQNWEGASYNLNKASESDARSEGRGRGSLTIGSASDTDALNEIRRGEERAFPGTLLTSVGQKRGQETKKQLDLWWKSDTGLLALCEAS